MKVFILIWMIQISPGDARSHNALVYTNAERCLSEQVQLEANLKKFGAHHYFSFCVKEYVRTKPEDFVSPAPKFSEPEMFPTE